MYTTQKPRRDENETRDRREERRDRREERREGLKREGDEVNERVREWVIGCAGLSKSRMRATHIGKD